MGVCNLHGKSTVIDNHHSTPYSQAKGRSVCKCGEGGGRMSKQKPVLGTLQGEKEQTSSLGITLGNTAKNYST